MKVLVACEFSGIVRDAFIAKGHDAYSCDIIESERPGPPCTYTCVSGNGTYAGTKEREEGIEFFRIFLEAPIEKICVEHPISVISTAIRPPDQYIQPWMFGHGEKKKTGLWLKNLPKLVPTNIVSGREPRVHMMKPGPNRWKERSRTFEGIAQAMAEQWG